MTPAESDSSNSISEPLSPIDAFGLAVRRFDSGNAAGALAICDQLIALNPEQVNLWQLSGLAAFALMKFAEAARRFEHAISLEPANVAHRVNLANTFIKLDRDDEAATLFEIARVLAPTTAEIEIGLGTLARRTGNLEEAIRFADRALALAPRSYQALVNRGRALHELEQFDEAVRSYDRAIAIDSVAYPAHVGKALSLLLQGDFAAGWREYEWRGEGTDIGLRARFTAPEWQGEAMAGGTLLVHAEQGFGDTIQFVRFLPQIAASGIRVVVEVQPAIKDVIALMLPGIAVRARGEPLPPFDRQIRLVSLPRVLNTSLETIPPPLPIRSMVLTRPKENKTLTVGLSWAGNPAHENDRCRSIAPGELAPLGALPGIRFVSVQKPTAEGQGAALPFPAAYAGAQIGDFTDLAQVLGGLDLLISVDSAPAHLMGAMGLPVWILLPRPPDWRWMMHRADSPWYPSARLFRQSRRGDWHDVIAQLVAALQLYGGENAGIF